MTPDWFPSEEIPELRNYHNIHKMTEGGFAEIYAADRSENGKSTSVIIKRLRPMYVTDPEQRQLFENEARFLKRLSHPQIPRFFEGFLSNEECFFIVEKLEGRDPSRLLKNATSSAKPFSTELALFIALQAGKVLEYLHGFQDPSGAAAPIIHGDVKPHNIIISKEPKVYLIDFSVATFLKDAKPNLNGTIAFMPPERFTGATPSFHTDLFGLTLSFYFLTTKEPLIHAKKLAELFGHWLNEKYLDSIRSRHFPKTLETFFLKNLAFQPEARAQSAGELVGDLQSCARDLDLELSLPQIQTQVLALETIR